MDLTKLAEMTDDQLKTYLTALRDTMISPYKCIWNKDVHRGYTQTKSFNYVRHMMTCKHRQDHTNQVISGDSPIKYPVYKEDYNNYRGCLMQMNGCYEFMYERLGDRGWRTYNNKIVNLMVRFFGKYCNMGKVGCQQSVMYGGDKWRVKKNKDTPFIMLDSKQMFNFFVNEFKPLLEEAMFNHINDSPSFEFWYFVLTGERTSGQKNRMKLEQQTIDNPRKCKIVGDHYIEKDTGKVVFTKNGKPIYGVNQT